MKKRIFNVLLFLFIFAVSDFNIIHTKAFAEKARAFCVNYFVLTSIPKVTMENIDGAVTPENYIEIKGDSPENVVLIINGRRKNVKKGKFSFNYTLRYGENDIKITVLYKNGDKENLRAVVTREIKHERNMKITVFVGGTFAIILIAYIITFSGWLNKRRLTKTD